MSRRLKILTIVGTRPETIKLAPVIQMLEKHPEHFQSLTCTTAQHREMVDELAEQFSLRLDHDLDVMQPNQSLSDLTSRLITKLDQLLEQLKPDWILVQGDTTTVMAASLVAFYRRIKIGHVEAGLRTYDRHSPFPEEINRRITDLLSDLYFAPTERSAKQLREEGVESKQIILTGNTVVDALEMLRPIWQKAQQSRQQTSVKKVLLTIHRRENHGERFQGICRALRHLAEHYGDAVQWCFPVHPNPNIRSVAHKMLSDIPSMRLLEPLPYAELLQTMAGSDLIVTDSGGIQEEAPSFAVPVVVLRDHTERPEGVEAGVVKLIGCEGDRLIAEVRQLLEDPDAYQKMVASANPYGDGFASQRIIDAILQYEGLA